MNDNTFAGDFIFGFVTKHRRVSVMFSDSYLPRGAVSWWIFYASVDHHVKSNNILYLFKIEYIVFLLFHIIEHPVSVCFNFLYIKRHIYSTEAN